MMGFWNSFFADTTDYEVWDSRPGGTVVDKYVADGVTYLVVEFKSSPGQRYTFLEKELDKP